MAATATLISSCSSRSRSRTALVTSADGSFRQRLNAMLTGLRWQVREAQGGAEAWGEAMDRLPQAIIVDSWLPDLDMAEFLREFRLAFPDVDVITAGSATPLESAPGPHRQEILYALRRIQETDTAAWNTAPILGDAELPQPRNHTAIRLPIELPHPGRGDASVEEAAVSTKESRGPIVTEISRRSSTCATGNDRILELIGNAPCMLEVSRRVRLVAPRSNAGADRGADRIGQGTGGRGAAPALYAQPQAIRRHQLRGHSRRRCLKPSFSATRAAHLPARCRGAPAASKPPTAARCFWMRSARCRLALQSKLLRFVECGELQRVGDNETVKVDVRIVAATHRPLAQHAQAGSFRSDLYYRLAVFLIRTPALPSTLRICRCWWSTFWSRWAARRR